MNYTQLFSDCWALGTSYLPLCGLPSWTAALLPGLGGGEVISLRDRRFRVLQKLGEGGYAVVLLVAELPSPAHPHPDPEPRALKKVLVQGSEHLAAVSREMRIHAAAQHHPHVLPLLDCCCPHSHSATAPASVVAPGVGPAAGSTGIGMLGRQAGAPEGAVAVTLPGEGMGMGLGLAAAPFDRGTSGGGGGGDEGGGGGGGGAEGVACFLFPVFRDGTLAGELAALRARGELLPSREALQVFLQLVKAVRHIHSLGFAHRDIKPLNVLIAKSHDHTGTQQPTRQQQRRPAQHQRQQQQRGRGGTAGGQQGDLEEGAALTAVDADGGDGTQGPRYRCVLMDFGSARSRWLDLASRQQALALQEDAEAHCSAPYRAPELFDAPSPARLDLGAADVWALGACLFELMYGEPPFARAMNAAGGSLALAVLNCAIGWPRPPAPAYPPALHALVAAAMAAEPGLRPSAEQLSSMVEELLQQPLPDPAPQGAAPGRR